MPQYAFASFDTPQKIYTANPKCPRTVVVQAISAPGDSNVFISTDQQSLVNAQSLPPLSGSTQVLTAGFAIFDFSGLLDNYVIPNVRADIWARANSFPFAGAVILAVEEF